MMKISLFISIFTNFTMWFLICTLDTCQSTLRIRLLSRKMCSRQKTSILRMQMLVLDGVYVYVVLEYELLSDEENSYEPRTHQPPQCANVRHGYAVDITGTVSDTLAAIAAVVAISFVGTSRKLWSQLGLGLASVGGVGFAEICGRIRKGGREVMKCGKEEDGYRKWGKTAT